MNKTRLDIRGGWLCIEPAKGTDVWTVRNAGQMNWYMIGLEVIIDPSLIVDAEGLYWAHLDSIIAVVNGERK